jgi:hypothetical protein
MSAMQTKFDGGRYPDRTPVRRQHPASIHPNPTAAHPIPIAWHPYIFRTGRGTYGSYDGGSGRRRRRSTDRDPEVHTRSGNEEGRNQNGSDKQSFDPYRVHAYPQPHSICHSRPTASQRNARGIGRIRVYA